MKKYNYLFLISLSSISLLFSACKKDETIIIKEEKINCYTDEECTKRILGIWEKSWPMQIFDDIDKTRIIFNKDSTYLKSEHHLDESKGDMGWELMYPNNIYDSLRFYINDDTLFLENGPMWINFDRNIINELNNKKLIYTDDQAKITYDWIKIQ